VDFNQNYFEIFGLPINFGVDIDLLADRYLELQKEVHPDNFAASTDQEKRLSMQFATLVNTANQTLRSGLPRAIYMLELQGVEIAQNPVLPPAFLMEQIELREQLDDIAAGDGDLAALDGFKKTVKKAIDGIEGKFESAIGSDAKGAEQAVYELQFLTKLLDSANQLEEKLLDY
jgi:molecular chaperone HscB